METASFSCRRCGTCCRAEGYVPLESNEIQRLALALNLDPTYFTDRFTRLLPDRKRLALIERADGSCVFLQRDNHCSVHDIKPMHCRMFPHHWSFEKWETICQGMVRKE
ncbi:MAG: hypothetical protein A2269_01220 [Lentisphaerae bacterium RIFOXYA12_FULL_60_10]|nr:MAG: hypothetical protein A2269_01220 [Lentisphaerae bacterium RIFOXYA12_FULL_60_10]